MKNRLLSRVILVCAATAALAQEPQPAHLRATLLEVDDKVDMTLKWRFRAGDDPSWSAPDLDDSKWEIVAPEMPPGERPHWTGVGWFRRHITFDSGLRASSLVLSIESPGSADVFVDGVPVMIAPEGRAPSPRGQWTGVKFSDASMHVLAVRYRLDTLPPARDAGFKLSIARSGSESVRLSEIHRRTTIYGFVMSIPLILAVLHFGLYTFYPRWKENLFLTFCLLSFAVIVFCELLNEIDDGAALEAFTDPATFIAVLSSIFFGLCTYFAISFDPMPRSWIPFAIVGVLLIPLGFLAPDPIQNLSWALYFVASVAEIVRAGMRGRHTVNREGAMLLLVGMLLLDAAIAVQILISFGLLPAPFAFSQFYLFGILAFSIAASLYIARSFARTSVNLERRLAQIDTLNAQMIVAEREAARKNAEIEAARTLQRSILPSGVPNLPHLDIAAKITTASEVGGDYYDFRAADDSVIVAVGDAAGHGVAAGAMVTATKALFSSLAGEERLPQILAQCDRVLRGMNVRPLYMCLQLARVSRDRVTVTSAAMPRALLLRAGSSHPEEIAASGVPLASGLPGPWMEESASLAAGDTLLFASDGLAEALSPDGEALGYERVAALFSDASNCGSADGIATKLMEEAHRWRGANDQNDDIAIVVVRVS